ncbi:MAG: hypothetical protein IT305_25445 [Chloroflexi bacterium]|nr:hypothetical protein [Chloroflexota bacterium]
MPNHTRARLGSALVGLLVALVLVEGILRLVGPIFLKPRLPLTYDPAVFDAFASGELRIIFDPDLGWTNTPAGRPGGVGQNSAGMRGEREYPPTPPPGVRRLAAYGDSFTYCSEVALDDCWTHRLEASAGGYEVLNFGVSAYGPDQAWLRYQHGGADWHPCAVTIGHMVENINRVVNRYRPFYDHVSTPLAKPRFLLDDGRLVLLPSPAHRADDLKDPAWVEANLGPHDRWYFPGTLVPNPLDTFETVRLVRTAAYRVHKLRAVDWPASTLDLPYQEGTEAFDVLIGVLAGFAADVRATGATPVVLVFPHRDAIIAARDGHPKRHAPLLAALAIRGIATLDLTDVLGAEARRTPLDQLIGVHYQPAGNALVAHTLAERLPATIAPTCGPAR